MIRAEGFFPENITGFGGVERGKHCDEVLRTQVYQAVRMCKKEVISWGPPTYPKNFYQAFLIGREQ